MTRGTNKYHEKNPGIRTEIYKRNFRNAKEQNWHTESEVWRPCYGYIFKSENEHGV